MSCIDFFIKCTSLWLLFLILMFECSKNWFEWFGRFVKCLLKTQRDYFFLSYQNFRIYLFSLIWPIIDHFRFFVLTKQKCEYMSSSFFLQCSYWLFSYDITAGWCNKVVKRNWCVSFNIQLNGLKQRIIFSSCLKCCSSSTYTFKQHFTSHLLLHAEFYE